MLENSSSTIEMANNVDFWSHISLSDFASTIIALCALIFTVWQSRKQRIHDRLSVKPHLDILEQRNHFGSEVSFCLEIKNNGLGPAIIRSHKIYKGSEGTKDYELVEDLEAELNEMLDLNTVYTSELHPNFGLSANTSHPYLLVKIESNDPEASDQLRSALYCKYNIEIEYESMYGERFTFSTKPYTENRVFLKDRHLE